ncbi:hypothetical protein [Halobacteriovorax sp.]|uniref:hypothetical protein n=1 Tax=Halobacteriovorax sp. TaxID=2020862 RepID=UPI003568A177
MKRFISAILIYLISFQLAFAETILRVPASESYTYIYSSEELLNEINEFKDSIKGKDLKATCSTEEVDVLEDAVSEEEEVEEDFFGFDEEEVIAYDENTLSNWEKIVKGINEVSCGQYLYTFDENLAKEEAQRCVPQRVKGHIEKFAEKVMKLEEEDRESEIPSLGANDELLTSLNKKATLIKTELNKYLYDENIDEEIRRNLLVNYLGGVLLPMRDLVVSKRSYVEKEYDGKLFYESLLTDFPTDLFEEDEIDQRKLITLGPNEQTDPYHLSILDETWGKSRLVFNENEILSRDVLTLVKTPTKRNYVRALKWFTLHMMMSQIYVYQAMLGDEEAVDVPKSCQSHFNGSLPEKFKFNFSKGQGDTYLQNIMSGHGLTFSLNNYQYLEYFMDNADKDPTKMGYSGLLPFEEYKSALRNSRDGSHFTKSDIDDVSHYTTVVQMKLQEAMSVFKGKMNSSYNRRTGKHSAARTYTYAIGTEFQKFFEKPSADKLYETKLEDGTLTSINTQRQNLSLFLAELMQRKGATHYTDIMSERLIQKLNKNKSKIKFPSLYGSAVWRNWALNKIAFFLESKREVSKTDISYKDAQLACHYVGKGADFCKDGMGKHIVAQMADYLKEFVTTSDFVPLRRLEEMKIEENYPVFGYIWNINTNRGSSDFSFSDMTEYDFLTGQMQALNPWASVRLSYLIALDELEHVEEGITPKFIQTRRGKRVSSETKTQRENVKIHIEMLKKAAKKLNIDKVLVPSYANNILSEDEKDAFWNDIAERVNEENSNIFQTELDGKSYYSRLEDLSYETLLTRENVERYEAKSRTNISSQAWDEIDDLLESDEGQIGQFFLNLYNNKGNVDQQIAMFEEFSQENGIDNKFSAKMNFLSLDNGIKSPIFKDLIKEAAHVRKLKVLNNLNEFCNMNADTHEDMKTLFYATSKAQNQLNQLAGLPGVPENVLDKINSMSDAEWTDMWLGLGAGFLGIGAILIGAACTGVTGGLCAPLGIAMIAAGTSALTMQSSLIYREVSRKSEADANEEKIKKMEDMGFATSGSSDEVSRTWGWAIFEAVSLIPMVGVIGRAVKVGSKMTYVSARTMLRNTGKIGFKKAWNMAGVAGKTAATEADVSFARYVLGFKSLQDDLAKALGKNTDEASKAVESISKELVRNGASEEAVKNAMSEMENVKHLYRRGKITMNQMTKKLGEILSPFKNNAKLAGDEIFEYSSNVVVRETPEMINKKTAEVVADYFGHNPKVLQRLLESYKGKWFSSHDKLVHARAVMNKANKGEYLWGTNWIKKFRFEQLAKNGKKINNMINGLDQVAKNGDDLTEYLIKNMEDLSDIFVKIPVRKREIPYMVLLEGGPHTGGVLKNTSSAFVNRVSGAVYDLADGLIMKKFLNARVRLVYESTKASARETFGLSKQVAAETTFEALKAFDKTVDEAILSASAEKSKKISKEMDAFQEAVAKRVHEFASQKISSGNVSKFIGTLGKDKQASFKEFVEMSPASIKKLLFKAEGPREEALAQVIWSSAPIDNIFEMKNLGDMAYKVVRELSEYNTAGEFDKFVNALKVLIISRDPGVVDFM